MTKTPLSYANDIFKLFRDSDVVSMRARNLDLSRYDHVSARANDILFRLELGDMPCDEPWPPEKIDKFRTWISDGKLP